MKHDNIHIIGVPGGQERKQKIKNPFGEIMTKTFLNQVKEKDKQVQEKPRVQNKTNPKRPTPRQIIIKMVKVKDKEILLKAARETQLPARELP